METISYLDAQGTLSKSCKHAIPEQELIQGYKAMLTTRYTDERMIVLQRQGAITFAMSSLGEEACAVASISALDMGDWAYPQYREAGIMFWRGFTPQQYIHQMFGNGADIAKGRQMPNHFGSRKLNVVHLSSPIASQIPHAAGCAYAMLLQKDPHVTICYFGDGATSEGDFHVGLNFAAVRKAPVIFFCRNNGYAISTPCHQQFASDGIAPKGIGYGITTYRVDGNDYFAIHETVAKARRHCLEEKGPVLIEAMTYRLGAHSTSDDPSVYRQPEEAAAWEKKDPILRLRLYLEKKKLWDAAQEEAFKSTLVKEVNEAIAAAKATPAPPLRSIVEDVYFECPPYLEEQYEELKTFFPDSAPNTH